MLYNFLNSKFRFTVSKALRKSKKQKKSGFFDAPPRAPSLQYLYSKKTSIIVQFDKIPKILENYYLQNAWRILEIIVSTENFWLSKIEFL